MTQHHCNTHVYCRCVRYDDGWTAGGCHVVNNLLLGVDQHVDCSCQQVAVSYAVLIDMPRPPSTVGYTVWFHVCCFFCIASFTIDLLLCISLSGCMVLGAVAAGGRGRGGHMPPGAEGGGRRQGVGGNFFRKENECSISSVNCYEVRGHSHNAYSYENP